MLDARVGVLALAGGLFLLFPVFNTLNAETVSVDYTPPELDPPDNLPPIDPPPFQPPPDAMPPCMDQDVHMDPVSWIHPGFPPQAIRYNDSHQVTVPPNARTAILTLTLDGFVGDLAIDLWRPDGSNGWNHHQPYGNGLAAFLGAGGVDREDSFVVELVPGSWTLSYDNQVTAGSATLDATIQIRCENPEGAAPEAQPQAEGGRRAGP